MNERLVLIDSSVWIAHFAGRDKSSKVQSLMSADKAAINPVIRLEVLTGVRDETQYIELETMLESLHFFELTTAVWRRAERLRFQLRRSGHILSLPDIVIAACALIYDCELLHADRHFEIIAHASELKVYH